MFPHAQRKQKLLVFTIGVSVCFMVVLLLRSPVNDNVSVNYSLSFSYLGDYILRHQVYVHNNPDWTKDCDGKYGIKMIQEWNTTRFDLCTKQSSSKITCYLRYDEAVNRRLCLLINTKVQLYEPYYKITYSNSSSTSEITMSGDIVSADCEPKTVKYNGKQERKMQYDSLLKVDEFKPSRKIDLQCEHNVNHTVFWIWRWDATNVYHFMEDILNTFVSLILFDEDPDDVEIVIYDAKKGNLNNPLFTFWSELFGSKGVRIIENNPFPANTCFKRSITSMYGMRSHLTEYGGAKRDTHCPSPILKGFQDWTTDKLQLNYNVSEKYYTLIFISRQQYLPQRNIARVFQNEDEIINAIKEKFPFLNVIIFRPENYSTFKKQVEIVIKGNIMVGAHGAALAYSLFMTPGSQLIEIFMDDRTKANRHFHNIASWMDLQYQSIGHYKKVVPPDAVTEVIGKAVDNLSKSAKTINARRV